MLTRFWWGNLRKKEDLADLGLDGRIILKYNFKKWDGRSKDRIYLAQDRDR